MDKEREEEFYNKQYEENKKVFIEALSSLKFLDELPDTEEEILRWQKINPQKAEQLEKAIDYLIGEFNFINLKEEDDSRNST